LNEKCPADALIQSVNQEFLAAAALDGVLKLLTGNGLKNHLFALARAGAGIMWQEWSENYPEIAVIPRLNRYINPCSYEIPPA
jgi:hypothetical protein